MTLTPHDFETGQTPTWCPGCGDFGVWTALKKALASFGKQPYECVVVFDIGCSGNMADKLNAYTFHGLHGRAVPVAEGIKLANHHLPVIVIGGDGGGYGEGLNHLLHSVRGNHDITYIVQDNEVYGLTKGQTSPTSEAGFKSPSTPDGVLDQPVHPLALAILGGATFVARGFASETDHLSNLITKALHHSGFSLIDILQPCVTFNHLNTYHWYRERLYKLEEASYTPNDRMAALAKAMEWEAKIPIGVLLDINDRPAYHESVQELSAGPVAERVLKPVDVRAFVQEFA